MAANQNGIIPPMRRNANVRGSSMLTPFWKRASPDEARIRVTKAPKSARETSAAEPIAKPFPIAAVVFPKNLIFQLKTTRCQKS